MEEEELAEEGALDLAISEQREFFWKAAILGITNQPLANPNAVLISAQGEQEVYAQGPGAPPVDTPFQFPWPLLSLVILGLLVASVPLTFAFIHVTPSTGD
jgi:hypothetical protein